MYIYVTSVYFITTSASTIGYGDYGAKSTIEMLYVIIVQFTGMSVFSIISGAYKEIIKMPSVNDVIDNKVQDITMYLQRIDKVKNDSLDDVIYDETVEYVKISYLYGVVQTLHGDHQFYVNLTPELKKKLVFTLLSNYYQKLFFFFNDNINHNYADLIFIRKILSRLDCVLYLNNSKIVASSKQFHSIFFIWKGSVTIVCPSFKYQIAKLPEESFFGDYQIILNIRSEFNFIATSPGKNSNEGAQTWCMTIDSQTFTEFLEQFPATQAFMTARAIQRRAYFRKVHLKLKRNFIMN